MRSISISIMAAGCSLLLAASGWAEIDTSARQEQQQVQERQSPQNQYAYQLMEPDQLTGLRVHDAQGEEIGTVEQIVLDPVNGRIGYIVVTSGGFLGMGAEQSIIPWSAVRFRAHQDEPFLMVDVPGERLLAAPHGDVQDLDLRYAELIHQYYGVAPYWHDPPDVQEQTDPRRQHPSEPARESQEPR